MDRCFPILISAPFKRCESITIVVDAKRTWFARVAYLKREEDEQCLPQKNASVASLIGGMPGLIKSLLLPFYSAGRSIIIRRVLIRLVRLLGSIIVSICLPLDGF